MNSSSSRHHGILCTTSQLITYVVLRRKSLSPVGQEHIYIYIYIYIYISRAQLKTILNTKNQRPFQCIFTRVRRFTHLPIKSVSCCLFQFSKAWCWWKFGFELWTWTIIYYTLRWDKMWKSTNQSCYGHYKTLGEKLYVSFTSTSQQIWSPSVSCQHFSSLYMCVRVMYVCIANSCICVRLCGD